LNFPAHAGVLFSSTQFPPSTETRDAV